MGANLVNGGATFRAWAPRATAVYVNGTFSGVARTEQTDDLLMARDANGYWTGFVAGASDGDIYHFYVVGQGSRGYKRDPYAREMARDTPFPTCSCLTRPGSAYPWHDSAFVTPDFSNMIVYQLHVGTYAPSSPGVASTFLDVIGKIEYIVALGINVLQPLPIDEIENNPSMGYNGADYFSPDIPYVRNRPDGAHWLPRDDQSATRGEELQSARAYRYRHRSRPAQGDGRPMPSLRHRGGLRRGL